LAKKKILILVPFFGIENAWIDDFCQRKDLEFWKPVLPSRQTSWHQRGKTTPLREWLYLFSHAYKSLRWKPDCVVTCFPQLAFIVALLLFLHRRGKPKLLAWTFNLGSLPGGWKRVLAKFVLSRVDLFIIHARSEATSYAEWLGISDTRFQFVPWQQGHIELRHGSPIEKPYIVSMGSANRDYATLVEAVLGEGIKLVIISKESILDSLPDHPDLLKLHGLTLQECNSILSDADLNIVPLRDTKTAAGQVTIISAMQLGIPTIVTRSVGSVDYIDDGRTGLFVPVADPSALRTAIASLLQNPDLRKQIGNACREKARIQFSDLAAAGYLSQTIDRLLE
jgi:glycosyltransferase involved in cell wall biosynthesis